MARARRSKARPKRPRVPAPRPKPVDDLDALLAVSVVELRAQLAVIAMHREAMEGGEFNRELPMATAAIVRSLTSAVGERRQLARAAVKAVEDVPLDAIMGRLKAMPLEQRKRLCRDILDQDDDRPVL